MGAVIMARPMYERENDLDKEREVAEHLSKLWGYDFIKLPIRYNLDYMLFDSGGTAKAVAEIKCRGKKYDTLILSLEKWNKGINYFKANGLEFILLVRWPDGLYYFKYCGNFFNIKWGGRKDRNDCQDMEPVVHIPSKEFIKI
jgi:hypothetical protein|tara:strand:- start:1382 stop:1810 length:429 start_codon:yes stop_codon:yes gene_type:complete